MQYFVTIEDNVYFHWQIELLIESFNMANMQDDLHILLMPSMEENYANFYPHNLVNHKNKTSVKNPNWGKNNCLYGVLVALKNNVLKPPFVLLHSDMVLLEPLKITSEAHIAFHPAPYKENIPKLLKKNEGTWLHFGDAMYFSKDIPISFFEKSIFFAQNTKKTVQEDSFRAGMSLAFANIGNLSIERRFMEVSLMHTHLNANFIHYRNGLPPDFSKQQFKREKNKFNFSFKEETPFDLLESINPNPVTNRMQEIIASYKKNNPK